MRAVAYFAVISALALAPAFRRDVRFGWLRAHAMAVAAALVALFLVWFARGLVPPAPLFLARSAVARDVGDRAPVARATARSPSC